MKRKIVTFGAFELDQPPAGYDVVGGVTTREELQTALSTLRPEALLVDVDREDAPGVIVTCREQHERMAIVGVTDGKNIQRVISAQRAGCDQITTRPLDLADLADALCQAMPEESDPQSSRIFSVLGVTGGAGATMLSCTLPFELSRLSGKPSLLIDLDLELGGVARAFDLAPSFTIGDLAKLDAIDPENLRRCAAPLEGGSGVCVLARPQSIGDAHTVTREAVGEMLTAARQSFRNVVIDLPRKLDEFTGAAIERSDAVLLVAQLTVPSADNAARLVEALESGGVPREQIHVVINRYRKNVHACTADMMEQRLRIKPRVMIPSDYAAAHEAFDRGEQLPERHPIRSAVCELAQILLGVESEKPGGRPANGNKWLSKLGLGRTASP